MRPEVKNMISTVTAGNVAAAGTEARPRGTSRVGTGQPIRRPIMGALSAAVAENSACCGNVPGSAVAPRPVTFHPHGATPPSPADMFGIHSDGPLQVRNVVVPAVMIFRTSQYRPGSGTADRYPFVAGVVVDSFAPAPVARDSGVPAVLAGCWYRVCGYPAYRRWSSRHLSTVAPT